MPLSRLLEISIAATLSDICRVAVVFCRCRGIYVWQKVVDSCRVRRQNHDSNKLRHNKHDKEGAPQQWCVTKIILFGKRPDMTNHNELQTRHGDDVWSKPKTTGDCTCC